METKPFWNYIVRRETEQFHTMQYSLLKQSFRHFSKNNFLDWARSNERDQLGGTVWASPIECGRLSARSIRSVQDFAVCSILETEIKKNFLKVRLGCDAIHTEKIREPSNSKYKTNKIVEAETIKRK